MTYLVISLASCLFFAQLLGLLLGWLLWGYVSMQRKKEIVMLRKRLADSSLQIVRPLEETGARAGLLGGRESKNLDRLPIGSEAVLGDLPPLVPIPPEPDSPELNDTDSSNGTHKDRETVVLELQRQVEILKSQLTNISSQKEAHTNQLKSQIEALTLKLNAGGQQAVSNESNLQMEVERLRAQAARAGEEKNGRGVELEQQVKALTAEVNSTSSERDRTVFEAKALRMELEKRTETSADLERRLHALNLDVSVVSAEKEKAAGELKTARADFEKRSAWLTKRIHELERSAEEWERTKQELTLARRADASKSREGDNSDTREAAFADLKDRLAKASSERDALAAELAGHKNGASAVAAPEPAPELQELLRSKDSQLTEQVARVERLLWRVSELESATGAIPRLEEQSKGKDKRIEALASEAAERDAHVRTLLRRMTELEPLNDKVSELKAALAQRDQTGPEITAMTARLRELEAAAKAKDAEITDHLAAHAENEKRAVGLKRRLAELEQVAANAAVMEGSLREKQAALAKLQASHAEQGSSIAALKQRVEAVQTHAKKAEQELAAKHEEALTLQARLQELTPLPAKLQDLADKHQSDLTRLKVSSAQRIRRLRQGITGFKS